MHHKPACAACAGSMSHWLTHFLLVLALNYPYMVIFGAILVHHVSSQAGLVHLYPCVQYCVPVPGWLGQSRTFGSNRYHDKSSSDKQVRAPLGAGVFPDTRSEGEGRRFLPASNVPGILQRNCLTVEMLAGNNYTVPITSKGQLTGIRENLFGGSAVPN
jgi:hypothetical protein